MTHVISTEAKKIIDEYWPTRPKDYRSLPLYREMQLELIRYHFPEMNDECKKRTLNTIMRLEKNKHGDLI